jgi:hypothetical protein
MAVNYNDRTGVLGIDLTPQFNNSFQTAGLFGFGKSDEEKALEQKQEKALEQIQDLRKQENQIKGLGEGAIEIKKDELQNIQNQIENLKKQYPNDSSIQSASLPSNRYTADLRNLNDRMTDIPDRLSRGLDYDLINKVREYNPNYDRYTDQEITELGIPIFNKTMPSSMNSGVTNANNFRSMLLDDLRNLPSDFRTSLGQTKDALVEDVSGLKDTMQRIYGQGKDYGRMAIDGILSAVTGIPGIGLLLKGINPNPPSKIEYDYLSQSGYSPQLKSIYGPGGIMENYNAISAFGPGPINSIINRRNKILARIEAGKSYGKVPLEKLNQAIADLGVSEYRALRPESERNVTGPSGGGRDNTGGDIGSKGAADQFSNKSGFGRTGY